MTKKTEKTKNDFNLNEALKTVNPYLLNSFKKFIESETISDEKTFNKLLKEFGELR